MKVMFVIGQLLCGGSEHVIHRLFLALKDKNYTCQLVVLGDIDRTFFGSGYVTYKPNLERLKFKKITINYKKIQFIRKEINGFKPDVVMSFIDVTNVLTIFSSFGLKVPVIISERNNPKESSMSKIWYLLRKIVYPHAGCLVVANEGLREICTLLKYNKNISVIPNLVSKDFSVAQHGGFSKKIVAIGSLSRQKRFDILIEAISLLYNKNKLDGYTVDLYGDGALYLKLKQQIIDLNLESVITLCGRSDRIYEKYRPGQIFVLCSDYEGQPNVLLEAMRAGFSCISTDCMYGPSEIIDNNKNGLLVPISNSLELANSVHKLILDSNFRYSISKNAQIKIKKYYAYNKILTQWMDLFSLYTN